MTAVSQSFATNIAPIIEKNINPHKIQQFNMMVRKFFDRHSDIMADTALYNVPYFTKEEGNMIYTITGLSEPIMRNAISQSKAIDPSWKTFSASGVATYIAYTMYIRYLVSKNRKDDARIVYMFLAMRMYTTIFPKYFEFKPNRAIIDYTVSQLSNKFDIKRLGSFAKAFYKMTEASHEKYIDELLSTDDALIVNYLTSLRTRIKGFIQNFFGAFKEAWKSGAYLNVDVEETFDDNPNGDKKERGNNSDAIQSRAISFQIWFVSNRIDERAVKQWCREAEVSPAEIMNVLENVQKTKDPIMEHMMAALLSLYADHTRDYDFKGVCSRSWIPFALSQFIKTNTDNPMIIQLKQNFDTILTKYCHRFVVSKRDATRSAYRKAILLYLAFSIQKFMCH